MNIYKADKIFIEPSDDLTDVIDRALNSEYENILLILPGNAEILSSIISFKLLFRSVLEKSKVVIIVCEDEYGRNVSQRSGFVTVQKVSQVTSELWDIAVGRLDRAKIDINNKKDELLGERKPAEFVEEKEVEVEITDEEVIEQYEEELDNLFEDEEIEEDYDDSSDLQEDEQNVQTIGGIKILGGGDVAVKKKDLERDKILSDNKISFMDQQRQGNTDEAFSQNRFAGRDLTRMTGSKSSLRNLWEKIFPPKKIHPDDRFNDVNEYLPFYKNRKFLIAFGIVIVIIFAIYFSLYQLPRVAVNISLETEEVVAQETIELNYSENAQNDVARLQIPARRLTLKRSISNSAVANGESNRGERARGRVYLFNTSMQEVVIPKGTRINSVANGLDYEFTDNVTLPAAREGDDGTTQASRVDNVTVQAISYGEQFNIPSTASSSFTISDFDSALIDINREGAFQGGTLEKFTSVSKENLDSLKAKMEPELSKEIEKAIRDSVPTGFVLIEKSIKMQETQSVPNPEVDKEARRDGDRYIFDLTIEAEGTAVIVRESDLNAMIRAVILGGDAEDAEINTALEDLSGVEVTEYKEAGESSFIEISAQGEISNPVKEDEIKNSIKGKSISTARGTISKIEKLKEFEINFQPTFIPESLRRIPTSTSRININFK